MEILYDFVTIEHIFWGYRLEFSIKTETSIIQSRTQIFRESVKIRYMFVGAHIFLLHVFAYSNNNPLEIGDKLNVLRSLTGSNICWLVSMPVLLSI